MDAFTWVYSLLEQKVRTTNGFLIRQTINTSILNASIFISRRNPICTEEELLYKDEGNLYKEKDELANLALMDDPNSREREDY